MEIRLNFKIILILLVIGVKVFTLFAQGQVQQPQLALENVIIHFSSKPAVRLQNPEKKYRLQKLDLHLIKVIQNDLLEQLNRNAYYLASTDSFFIEQKSGANKGLLHLYFSPGPRFVLTNVEWDLIDSLNIKYNEDIKDIVQDYYHRPYTADIQNGMLRRLLGIFENDGYPLCQINTTEFNIDSLDKRQYGFILKIQMTPGHRVKLAGIKLPLKSEINPQYLERTFRFKRNEIYRENRIKRYGRMLRKQDFIKTTNPPQVVVVNDTLFYLQLNFEENSTTAFDGVIGYIPPPVNDPDEKGYFTGLFNIGLRNLFGTGRRMDVYWQKPDRYSEEFRVKYREPFVVGLPFHAGVEMHRLIRDTTYIEWEYSINGQFPLNENLTGLARFYSRQVFPDSLASAVQRLPQTKAIHTELGFEWDSRNSPYNPSRGILLKTLFDYGTQRNVGPNYLLKEDTLAEKTNVTRVTGRLSFYFQFIKKQVLTLDFHTILIGYKGQEVQPPDMVWFGGATSVRGYREDQFFGEKVGWLNTEYRFILGPRSRFFVFTDFAYYSRKIPQKKEEYLTGYGLGVRFPGPLGDLQIDYGLARGLSFSEGKIHFRLINNF